MEGIENNEGSNIFEIKAIASAKESERKKIHANTVRLKVIMIFIKSFTGGNSLPGATIFKLSLLV